MGHGGGAPYGPGPPPGPGMVGGGGPGGGARVPYSVRMRLYPSGGPPGPCPPCAIVYVAPSFHHETNPRPSTNLLSKREVLVFNPMDFPFGKEREKPSNEDVRSPPNRTHAKREGRSRALNPDPSSSAPCHSFLCTWWVRRCKPSERTDARRGSSDPAIWLPIGQEWIGRIRRFSPCPSRTWCPWPPRRIVCTNVWDGWRWTRMRRRWRRWRPSQFHKDAKRCHVDPRT